MMAIAPKWIAAAAQADFAPFRDGRAFLAGAAGLARTRDGGQSWQDAYQSLGLSAPLPTLCVAAHRSGLTLAGVDEGVLRSEDDGETWQSIALPPAPALSAIRFSPTFDQDRLVFAATLRAGVLRSEDAGRSWAEWNFGLLDAEVICLAISPRFDQDQLIFAGTRTGIFRSANGGRSWQEPTPGAGALPHVPILSLAISPAFERDGTLFAGTETAGLWRSQDGGERWARVTALPDSAPADTLCLDQRYPAVAHLLAQVGELLLYSFDDGVTWQRWCDHDMSAAISAILEPAHIDADGALFVSFRDGTLTTISKNPHDDRQGLR